MIGGTDLPPTPCVTRTTLKKNSFCYQGTCDRSFTLERSDLSPTERPLSHDLSLTTESRVPVTFTTYELCVGDESCKVKSPFQWVRSSVSRT